MKQIFHYSITIIILIYEITKDYSNVIAMSDGGLYVVASSLIGIG